MHNVREKNKSYCNLICTPGENIHLSAEAENSCVGDTLQLKIYSSTSQNLRIDPDRNDLF